MTEPTRTLTRTGTLPHEAAHPAAHPRRTPVNAPRTVHALLADAVAARPGAPAVRDTEGAWTYTELARAAGTWSHWLTRQGVRPGDRVLVRLGSTRHFVALLFGTLAAGAVLVPVAPAMKPFHLARVLEDAEPALVIAAATARDGLTEPATPDGTPVHDITEAWAAAQATHPTPAPRPAGPPDGDALALLLYTSGSTALPKAVMSPHRAVVFATRAIADRLRYRADDAVLNAVPLSFDYGLYQIFLTVHAGAELVLSGTNSHAGLMTLLREHRITVFPVVPSLAQNLLRLARRDRRQPPPVRLFTSTGARLAPAVSQGLRAAFPTAEIAPMYGTTECKRITVQEPGGDLTRPDSVGRPLRGTEVLVLADDGTPLPAGQTGEIAVRGPHVMAGYWRAPALTRDHFRPDPVTGQITLHTGDFGHLDNDGELYVEGRRDDLFKRRGVRMSALEIEAAALDIPGVTAAALLPPEEGTDMILFATGGITPGDVLTQLAERLEAAKVPPVCLVLTDLPLTPNGKTDKKHLATLRPAGRPTP